MPTYEFDKKRIKYIDFFSVVYFLLLIFLWVFTWIARGLIYIYIYNARKDYVRFPAFDTS